MCKEMPVIPVNKVVDKKRIIRKRRVREEERHKEFLTPPPTTTSVAGWYIFKPKLPIWVNFGVFCKERCW
jgi:hypothetical protein